ncbi:MAG: hypothetical protein IKR56_01180 [Lachnospiraceae bacterium]|nr:hypothetical protein [Lachnospiraceae bacterium]
MNNAVLFFNSFLSYGLLFIISVAVMVIGGFIGVKARKAKDAKMAAQAKETDGANAGEV